MMQISYDPSRITEISEHGGDEYEYMCTLWEQNKVRYFREMGPMPIGCSVSEYDRCDNCGYKSYIEYTEEMYDYCNVCKGLKSDAELVKKEIKFIEQEFERGLNKDREWGRVFYRELGVQNKRLHVLESFYKLRRYEHRGKPQLIINMLKYKVLPNDLSRMLKSYLY